jgi:hypothetical protein
MVVYHAINYSAFRPLAFRYLAFLPPSFIFVAGFLVGQTYAAKYDLNRAAPYRRLIIRGLKILVLFTLFNLLLYTYEYRRLGWTEGAFKFGENSLWIYFVGTGRVAIFEVLLPIAYFLLAAPFLVYLMRFSRWFPAAIAVALFVACVLLESRGIVFDHLNLFSAGIIGMAFGAFPMERLNALASRLWIVLPLYALYRVLEYKFGERYAVQNFGVCATLLLLYSIALPLCSRGWPSRRLVQLGQYSLIGYLVQIAVLQVLTRLVMGQPRKWSGVIETISITLFVTTATVVVLHFLRAKQSKVDSAYRFVFA